MKTFFCAGILAAVLAMTARADDDAAVGHMVYFQLKDNSAEAKKKLVEACHKYLKGHDDVVYYSAGPRAEDIDSPVNAKDWDVALHLVFKTKAAFDKYAKHERHLKFIEENKENWKGVKVYDAQPVSSGK